MTRRQLLTAISNQRPTQFIPALLPHSDAQGVTPVEHFYVHRSHPVKTIDTADWCLTIGGKHEVTLAELRQMPPVRRAVTLAAETSSAQQFMMGNAVWQGVALDTVLGALWREAEVRHLAFRSVSGYVTYLPTSLLNYALLAYEMNGRPLACEQGYPVRLIVPGIYDHLQTKWLTAIEPVSDLLEVTDEGSVRTTSVILSPRSREVVNRAVRFSGVAFAGMRMISRIELSVDDGAWMPVAFQSGEEGCWTRWQIDWMPPAGGDYLVKVRATDSEGRIQSSVANPQAGTDAIHAVVFRVTL